MTFTVCVDPAIQLLLGQVKVPTEFLLGAIEGGLHVAIIGALSNLTSKSEEPAGQRAFRYYMGHMCTLGLAKSIGAKKWRVYELVI
jgi:hypothetical protein